MTCIATIVSANYLAYARTLAQSVAAHQPDAAFRVLIVDRATAEVRGAVASSGLEATYAEELGLPDFEHIAFKYELVELNTALKPTFLKRLFAAGFERVMYLDPDIRLFGSLEPVERALDDADIVLTPHACAPAMDGLRPSDIDFLRNGSFNLGFAAFKSTSNARRALDWWEDRCLGYGFNDLGFGTFVDQKWMDLAPCYFESVRVLRHPGCNVAYWNLHERALVRDGDGWRVNGEPLCFFHFSGVKASAPGILSRHQTRHSIVPGTPLAVLVADYCAALLRNEHERFAPLRYTFADFDDGVPINPAARRAACIAPMDAQPFAARGPLRARLRDAGLITPLAPAGPGSNTLSFDQDARSVRAVNALVRATARMLGVERFGALARYMAFLTRESNLARVLLKAGFEFAHRERGTRP